MSQKSMDTMDTMERVDMVENSKQSSIIPNPGSEQGNKTADKCNFLKHYEDVNAYSQQVLKTLVQATRSSNALPTKGDDFDYYSSFQAFRHAMDVEQNKILHLTQNIMRYHGAKGNLSTSSEALAVEDKFDVLVDANDQLLERVGAYLDEAQGLKKKDAPLVIASITPKQTASASWNKKVASSSNKKTGFSLLAARNIQRPQVAFKDKLDNSNRPFVPKIKEKPNALKSLAESLGIPENDSEKENFHYPHPYQYELDMFTPTEDSLRKVEPQKPRSLEETPLTYVDTLPKLLNLLKLLRQQKEIAVDLEHHSYRSFMGFLCLMQISTREEDFLVDTLTLRHELYRLNEVFTHPEIVKVMHGADMDIQWLQRDLGLYIVNLFDSHQAACILNFSRRSYAFTLHHYCEVTADKKYQMADWRIRPLPDELVKYAREDTHYLLYIYDRMRNDLIDKFNGELALVKSVFSRSKQVCAQLLLYMKPLLTANSHLDMYHKSRKKFNSRQLAALEDMYRWRDKMARQEDESTGYVLPNHMMLQIAEVLPREMNGILACCNPIPPLVRQCVHEVYAIVQKARNIQLTQEELPKPKPRNQKPIQPEPQKNSTLHCPHDFSHTDKAEDDNLAKFLSSLPKPDKSLVVSSSKLYTDEAVREHCSLLMRGASMLSVFEWNPREARPAGQTEAQKKAAAIRASFISPFAMYLPPPSTSSKQVQHAPEGRESVQQSSTEVTKEWKLLPNTKKRVRQEENPTPPPPIEKPTHIIFADSDDESTPVRQQMPGKQKKGGQKQGETSGSPGGSPATKKRQQGSDEDSDGTPESKRMRQDEFHPPQHTFKPYDYVSKAKDMFKAKQSTKKTFDPNSDDNRKKRGPSRPKFNPNSGKKSMTYSNPKGGSKNMHWPKR